MSIVMKLAIISFCFFLLSCAPQEEIETQPEGDVPVTEKQTVPEGQETSKENQEAVTQEVSENQDTPDESVSGTSSDNVADTVSPDTTLPPPQIPEEPIIFIPEEDMVSPSPHTPLPEPVSYTSFNLNGVVDILFFDEDAWFSDDDAIVLSQDISHGQTLLWLVENEDTVGDHIFSRHAHRLVKKLSAHNTSTISRQVCKGQDIIRQRELFFKRSMYAGTLVLVDNQTGRIEQHFGQVKDSSAFNGYRISSVTFEDETLTNITITSYTQDIKTLERESVPEGAIKSEFEVNVNKINLQSYYDFLNRLWDNGELSVCSANVT